MRRLLYLAAMAAVWGGAIFCKLISLQILHHKEYARMARDRQELRIEIPAPRGTIFDRDGQPLAMSVPAESVFIDPRKVDLDVASSLLAGVLDLDRTQLHDTMKTALENHRGFLWIKRKITPKEAADLRALHLQWIGFQRESERHYPNGSLAAHVLGSVDFAERGNAGIEKSMDADLRGEPGKVRLLTDVKRRGIESQLVAEAHPGASLTLTIDERVQFVAEREIAAAVEEHHAVSGSVVAMNPYTGEILALASYPTYDPNQPPRPGENLADRLNHAVSVPFEPGSVYKVITLSAALETTKLTPDSLINCHGGVLKLPGRIIHDSHGGLGVIPMAMVLAHSSNIGAIEVGLQVGEQNMYHYMRAFGFGQRSGIQLPAESPGKVRKLEHWGKTSLASVSMGQEVSVTTVQLAQAASVIANGGMLVRPRLILKKGDQAAEPAQPVRIIRPETAITMRQMMEGVVLHGTGTRAKLAGYSVGGKTGTAQIFDTAIGHYTHTYNGSFMGMAPLTNPRIVVVATVNGTHGESGFGASVAIPVFRVVVGEALREMDVPKDLPEPETPPKTLVAKNEDLDDLAIADAGSDQPNILQDGDEDGDQGPGAGGQGKDARSARNQIPDFRGMTMRAVLAEAAEKGLSILPDGSGVARLQDPPPGSALHPGERIRVQFAR